MSAVVAVRWTNFFDELPKRLIATTTTTNPPTDGRSNVENSSLNFAVPTTTTTLATATVIVANYRRSNRVKLELANYATTVTAPLVVPTIPFASSTDYRRRQLVAKGAKLLRSTIPFDVPNNSTVPPPA